MVKYIAVDSGKHTTKACTYKNDGTECFISFRTKMEETLKDGAKGKSFIVELNGKKYILGEQAGENSVSGQSSKAQELHKISTYVALHKLVTDPSDELVVAIGCPLSLYENSGLRRNYRDFMFPSKEITIKVNGVTKTLRIRSVVVLPEASGPLYLNPEYEEMTISVLDIGGLNLNICTYSYGVPITATMVTENLGSNVLRQNLKNALATKYGEDIPLWMMEDIIREGYLNDNLSADGVREGSREFIQEFKKNHIRTIVQRAEQSGYNLRLSKLIFSGGTSELLADEIKELFPKAIICEEASKANVRGFLKAITE